jgi:hypothetical protein
MLCVPELTVTEDTTVSTMPADAKHAGGWRGVAAIPLALRIVAAATAVVLVAMSGAAAASATPLRPAVPPTPPHLARTITITNAAPDGNVIPKLDTAGQRLDAHEGTIVYDKGLYWMVGNTYGCGYQWIHAPSAWCGFRTYSSPDLVTWTDRGATFNPSSGYFQSLCGYPTLGCFDARLIHDAAAGQWRMWFNAYQSRSGYVVMSAPAITGPWRLMPTPNLAIGNNHPGRGNGAGGLYLDPSGVGYLVYTAWTNGGIDIVEKLDSHMITGTGVHVHVPNLNAEAPSLFKAPDGTMVITYDDPGCAWCGGVPTSYATASAGPLGLWKVRGRISDLSCNGQAATQVAPLPGGELLWMADQWTNIQPGPRGPGVAGWNGMSDIDTMQRWNQTAATQHWEPLRIGSGGTVAPITCAATVRIPALTGPG